MSVISENLSKHTKGKPQKPLSQFSQQDATIPTNDSQQVSSNYVRYLSYLSFDDELQQNEDEHKLFWDITCKCLLYLRRQPLNTYENDVIMGHTFSQYFDLTKLDPKPVNHIGSKLIKNGYFLAAYVLLLTRLKDSPVYLKYFREVFSHYEITIGYYQLFHFLGVQKYQDNSGRKQSNDRKTEDKPVLRRLQLQEQFGYSVKTCK